MAQSRIELAKDLDAALSRVKELSVQRDEMRSKYDTLYKREEETIKQFSDLKLRLHNSEMENQRLRGYVQRVQEDDTVREELVAVGDPNGEQNMVPKRKSTVFYPPSDTTNFDGGTLYDRIRGGNQPKPKHWVNY